jgi:hypothetical protein
MAYKYDIFLSYANQFPFNKWTRERLLPLIDTYLTNELNRQAKIFFDKAEIAAGDAWPEQLKNALAHSRCLVAVWSPSYFTSKWCTSECAVMLNREMKLGYRKAQNPKGLILPLTIYDGDRFPEYARKIQWLDCRIWDRS